MISIAVVEKDSLTRETLGGWVESSPDHRCVCLCSNAREAMRQIPRYVPDVVLMGIQSTYESGFGTATKLREKLPRLGIILLVPSDGSQPMPRTLHAGGWGYLVKPSSRREILWAVAQVQSGGTPMSGQIARQVVEAYKQRLAPSGIIPGMSPREAEVLDALACGMSNKQIAAHLGISYETACVHLRRIYTKLQVQSRTEAVIKYLRGRHDRAMPKAGLSV